ncbi:MAG: hypothetical protein ABIQ03_04280 [Burkholderiales bacterium]
MDSILTVGWKVSSLTHKMASVRYRTVLPMLALEPKGIRNHIFSTPSPANIEGLDVLVFVKSLRLEDFAFATLVAQRGIPIVFDLCDNIFVEGYTGKALISPSDVFLMMSDVISAVVVSTEPLAEIVRQRTGDRLPVFVVPDGIETPALTYEVIRQIRNASLKESSKLGKVRSRLLRLLARVSELLRSENISSLTEHSFRLLIGLLNQSLTRSRKKVARFTTRLIKAIKRRMRGSLSRIRRYANLRYWLKKSYRTYDLVRSYLTSQPRRAAPSHVKSRFDTSVATKNQTLSNNATSDKRQILWFGNHGAAHANFGMLDLLGIRDPLEQVARETPVELVVVSNNYSKYVDFIKPMGILSRYVEWSPEAMLEQFRTANVVIVPNSRDEFSLCKSANRTVMALSAGVPVVATYTPALAKLRGCVEFDDFYGGIKRYLSEPSHAHLHIQKGQVLIKELFGQHAIGEDWLFVINHTLGIKKSKKYPLTELIVVLHLGQDIDLAVPILRATRERGLAVLVWCSVSFINRCCYVLETLRELAIPWQVMPDRLEGLVNPFPSSTRALLTISETNLSPHRFAHTLTKLACSAGIPTYTLQHGFENVGLTYSDRTQAIRNVRFASDRIFVWGPLELLHPDIEWRTRAKCIPVGCPKPASVTPLEAPIATLSGKTVVGIFENLHWHRYSDNYRDFFLKGVRQLASRFSEVTFVVKPHNAGLWLTGRYRGEIPSAGNLLIVDPSSKDWLGLTATQLMGYMSAVITSPSTVALDSARAGIPAAVVAYDLPLDNYSPLTQLRRIEDWEVFVGSALDFAQRTAQCKIVSDFAQRVVLPGDAAQRIVNEFVLRNS